MNSERNILSRLLEGNINTDECQDLDEKTYTVGDKQYWRRSGKCYCWTAADGRKECSEDEYMKAISGGSGDSPKHTEPEHDAAKKLEDKPKFDKDNPAIIDADKPFTNAEIQKSLGIDSMDWELEPAGFGDGYKDYKVISGGETYTVRRMTKKSEPSKKSTPATKPEPTYDDDLSEFFGTDKDERYTLDALSSMYGKSVSQVRKMVSDKKFSHKDVSKAIAWHNSKGLPSTMRQDRMKKWEKDYDAKHSTNIESSKNSEELPPARGDYFGSSNPYRVGRTGDFEKDMKFIQGREPGVTAELVYGDKTREYVRKIGPNKWKSDSGSILSDNDVASVAYDGGKTTINYMIKHKPAEDTPKADASEEEILSYKDKWDDEILQASYRSSAAKTTAMNKALSYAPKGTELHNGANFYKAIGDRKFKKVSDDGSVDDTTYTVHDVLKELLETDRQGTLTIMDPRSSGKKPEPSPIEKRRNAFYDDSESDYVSYDGVRDFDHTTWIVGDEEAIIKRNPSGRGYYLQTDEYDEDFDTKGDLVHFLRSRGAEFQGQDSEHDY